MVLVFTNCCDHKNSKPVSGNHEIRIFITKDFIVICGNSIKVVVAQYYHIDNNRKMPYFHKLEISEICFILVFCGKINH